MQGNPQNQFNNNQQFSNWNYDMSYPTQGSQQNQVNTQQPFSHTATQQQNWLNNQQSVGFTQPSTQQQRFVLPGHLVNDISEVQINEVPMDGSYNVFPLRDLSAIYLKFWDNDGRFKTRRYVLVDDTQSQNVENQNQTQMDEVMSKITSLESMVKKILRKSYKNESKGGNNDAK